MNNDHIFYSIQKIDAYQRKEILIDAQSKCYDWRVDILDCSVSWSRQKIDMIFLDIMGKFDMSCHFVIIHRKERVLDRGDYLEIGFSTMRGISYYLWIYLRIDLLQYFVNKYGLVRVEDTNEDF